MPASLTSTTPFLCLPKVLKDTYVEKYLLVPYLEEILSYQSKFGRTRSNQLPLIGLSTFSLKTTHGHTPDMLSLSKLRPALQALTLARGSTLWRASVNRFIKVWHFLKLEVNFIFINVSDGDWGQLFKSDALQLFKYRTKKKNVLYYKFITMILYCNLE